MISTNDQQQRLIELQSNIGKALWQIQALEDTLAHLIAVVLKMPANSSITEAEAILDKVRKDPLGPLIQKTKQVVKLDASFDKFLAKFLNERNWLVHRSWRTYHGYINKPDEYSVLRARLRRLASDALELNEIFANVLEEWVKQRGVTEAEIEQLQKQFLEIWE